MELAKIVVKDTTGAAVTRKRIPARLVGAKVAVMFDSHIWEGLQKTVIFRADEDVMPGKFDGETAKIPHELLQEPGRTLFFGIWGFDPASDLQLPLIEVRLGQIEAATDPDADPGTDPTLPVWAQQQAQIDVLKQQVGDLMENGQPSGPSTPGADGGYYTPQVTQPDAKTVRFGFTPSKQDMPAVDPVDVKLPVPESGGNADDGFSPIATVTQTDSGAVISITDKDGTTTATITNGKDGKDGVDGQDGYTPVKGVDYFDGQPGKDGAPGAPGYTPVRGTDYYTEADKTEMVNAVLSALPTWTGGSF